MKKKNKITIALMLVLTMSACTTVPTKPVEADSDVKQKSIETTPKIKKSVTRGMEILIAGLILKSAGDDFYKWATFFKDYDIKKRQIEKNVILING